ncbi:hypothetical protein O181_057831 [Austropuccinia psidii MF-1]|uniref:Uncharacterized protein n=1 Tax=Austropuccinia psidii MF-1 TaxID=1389203 RepID=A0A9Q3E927_9BASI|nr:hypothetical protein [Austropuccinia psidii MF-1]
MIQTLEDMISIFFAYGLEIKYSDGFTHYLCTPIPLFELAYKAYIQASTGKTPAMLEKGWNTKTPVKTWKLDSVDINPAASSFESFLEKVRQHENPSITDAFEYYKQIWDKTHKTTKFEVGSLTLA